MSSFVYVVLTFSFISICWSSPLQSPCDSGECYNLTVYLGPKWGSKVIHLPNHQNNTRHDKVTEKRNRMSTTTTDPFTKDHDHTKNVSNGKHGVDDGGPLVAKHKPIPDDGSVSVDYMGVDYLYPTDDYDIDANNSSRTRPSFGNANAVQNQDVLDLSSLGLTGDDVKSFLATVTNDYQQETRLHLNHNIIEDLPLQTFPLEMQRNLVELHLDNNPLLHISTNLSLELSTLSELKVLNLSLTSLRYLGSLYLPSLETLDLSNNMLTDMPTLGGLSRLRHLSLKSNRLTILFGTYTDVRVLNVANNNIFHVVHGSVRSMIMLEELYLNNNSLRSIELDEEPTSYAVYMSGNPLECDCVLEGIMRDRRSEVADWNNLTCESSMKENVAVTWFVRHRCHREVRVVGGPGSAHPVPGTRDIHIGYYSYNLREAAFTSLNIILILTVVVILAQKVRSHLRARRISEDVPYDILVNKSSVWVCSEKHDTINNA